MKITKGRYYKTRDGRKVRIYATDGLIYQIHGAILYNEQSWVMHSWGTGGSWRLLRYSDLDIVSSWPTKKKKK